MKVLFSTHPLASRLRSLHPYVEAAVAAGHEVVVATGPDPSLSRRRSGYQTWSVGPTGRQIWAELTAAPVPAGPADHAWSTLFARPSVARARELLPLAVHWTPDLVVHDPLDMAGAEVAALLGTRPIVVGPRGDDRLAAALGCVAAEFATELRVPNRIADILASPYLDTSVPGSAEAAELFADLRLVRPELDPPVPGSKVPLRLQRFDGLRLVLLSIGAGLSDAPVCGAALGGLSSMPINVVVQTGPACEVGALGSVPSNVAAARRLPYAEVLPLCSAVVGSPTPDLVAAAVLHGVPLLSVPRGLGQRRTAQRLAAAGLGLTLRPEQITPGAVRRLTADLLADPAYARAAQGAAAELRNRPTAPAVWADLTTTVPA